MTQRHVYNRSRLHFEVPVGILENFGVGFWNGVNVERSKGCVDLPRVTRDSHSGSRLATKSQNRHVLIIELPFDLVCS
jgi:hypothetical protein